METIFEILLDALLDSVKALPFLFGAYLIIEYLEHHSSGRVKRLLAGSHRLGPVAGALLGCIPQCGFSVAAANLYGGRVITAGALVAVFLSTSDEAIPVLLANPGMLGVLGKLMLVKVLAALAAGFAIDLAARRFQAKGEHPLLEEEDQTGQMCSHCGCGHSVVRSALHHTGEIFVFLFLTTLVLGGVLEIIGEERLSMVLMEGSIFQPALAGIIGLIPNCGASVLLTRLLMDGTLSFGAALAGLSTNAGVGLLVLFRVGRRHTTRNLQLMGVLYLAAVVCGILLQTAGV